MILDKFWVPGLDWVPRRQLIGEDECLRSLLRTGIRMNTYRKRKGCSCNKGYSEDEMALLGHPVLEFS